MRILLSKITSSELDFVAAYIPSTRLVEYIFAYFSKVVLIMKLSWLHLDSNRPGMKVNQTDKNKKQSNNSLKNLAPLRVPVSTSQAITDCLIT